MKLTASDATTHSIMLSALNAANPLAFLASLGALQLLTDHRSEESGRLGWCQQADGWRPYVVAEGEIESGQFIDEIMQALAATEPLVPPSLRQASAEATSRWAGKLKFPPRAYRQACEQAMEQSRRLTELLANWATDAATEVDSGQIRAQRTVWDFTAGNQSFLEITDAIIEATDRAAIEQALFGPWQYTTTAPSLRWDPADENRRYAHQAFDPQDGARNPVTAVVGAQRLALEGLRFFPLMPQATKVVPLGFRTDVRPPTLTWPVWQPPLTAPTVQSLLAQPDLQQRPLPYQALHARGVQAVFESQVIQPTGRYRNLSPARALL
jgi:hypothetical protein